MSPPNTVRSDVWKHFEKLSDTDAKCKYCKNKFKHSKNTTNLRKHLKARHVSALSARTTKNDNATSSSSAIISIPDDVEMDHPQITPSTQVSSPIVKSVRAVQSSLLGIAKPKHLPITKIKELDRKLIEFIARDYQPFSVVEDTGFQNFVKSLDPRYNIPTRKTVTNRLLPELYYDLKAKVSQILSQVEHIAITTDTWTSLNTDNYISCTVHAIVNYKLHSFVLDTAELPGSHTAQVIADFIQDTLYKWNINNKLVALVTDNASNMIAAANLLNVNHLPCVAHTINLLVKDAIACSDVLVDTREKCRAIVKHFKKSSIASNKLTKLQIQMKLPVLKLLQEVKTRWNSTHDMFQRLISVKGPLSAAMAMLPNAPPVLTNDEWVMIEELVPLLKPFLLLTEEISGEKYITISSVVPLIRGTQAMLRDVQPHSHTGIIIKDMLKSGIEERLVQYETLTVSSIACLLDPRFKNIGFGLEENASTATNKLSSELIKIYQKEGIALRSGTSAPSAQPPQQSNNPLWAHLEQKTKTMGQQNIGMSPMEKAKRDVLRYYQSPLLNRTDDPLTFWKEEERGPLHDLKELALKYLCVPASSVPSERLFSKAGQTITARRNRLEGKNVNKLLFCKGNIDNLF